MKTKPYDEMLRKKGAAQIFKDRERGTGVTSTQGHFRASGGLIGVDGEDEFTVYLASVGKVARAKNELKYVYGENQSQREGVKNRQP